MLFVSAKVYFCIFFSSCFVHIDLKDDIHVLSAGILIGM